MPTGFSPPKGIRLFSTLRKDITALWGDRRVSVPRRGFVSFLQLGDEADEVLQAISDEAKFQSPEGDSSLFYSQSPPCWCWWYSCFSPPKGIRLFSTRLNFSLECSQSRACFSPPKGIRLFSTRNRHRVGAGGTRVSVPRRGFVSFLRGCAGETWSFTEGPFPFQSPEGDSSLFYADGPTSRRPLGPVKLSTFQSPEGDSSLFYKANLPNIAPAAQTETVSVPRRGFVSFLPCFASLRENVNLLRRPRFSPPKGIRLFSTRGFAGSRQRDFGFSPPKGIRLFSTGAPHTTP
jgi:hypothetical protein